MPNNNWAMTDAQEIIDLYHIARAFVARDTRYDRMLWASKKYAEKYGITPAAAYKFLEQCLVHPVISPRG
jgi:hypothetical protein